MIDIKELRARPNKFQAASKAKNVDIDIDHILKLDEIVRTSQAELESIKAEKNEASKKIAKAGDDERAGLIKAMQEVDKRVDSLKEEHGPALEELTELLYRIPNPAMSDVSVSETEDDNEVIRTVGEKTEFDFKPKDHETIAVGLGILDKESAANASAARFMYLMGDGVLLQLALIQYALSITAKHGFTPIVVPHMINADSMRAMGYLEHGGHDEIYYLPKDNLYLIGTSEQAIGPMHKNRLMKKEELPLRYLGMSPCYRREAGGYGKDTSGIYRMHQFDKVEMFSVTTPENSEAEHELILSIEEELMAGLKLPYQVIKMVTGDLGLPAARKYDIETWMPSRDKYQETHSSSTTTDFQARRLNTRYKTEAGKNEFVHMLNGTAFAIGRTLIMILENNQEEDGSVRIPEVLQPFMGGKTKIEAKN
jgi:seryl-tRNA synthetase